MIPMSAACILCLKPTFVLRLLVLFLILLLFVFLLLTARILTGQPIDLHQVSICETQRRSKRTYQPG